MTLVVVEQTLSHIINFAIFFATENRGDQRLVVPFCQEFLEKFRLFLECSDATSVGQLFHWLKAPLEPKLDILFLPANPVIVTNVPEHYYTGYLSILEYLIVPDDIKISFFVKLDNFFECPSHHEPKFMPLCHPVFKPQLVKVSRIVEVHIVIPGLESPKLISYY